MAKVYLICGKICSGKSTYAKELKREKHAVVLSVDDIMIAIFGLYAGDKHDLYASRLRICLLNKAAEIAADGINVILDWGFWTADGREEARRFFEERGIRTELHYIKVADEDWERQIAKRNKEVEEGKTTAYIVDGNLKAKLLSRFEAPLRAELEVIVKK